ncbi:mechanosensitive ion channel domain-containing protein [Flavobacterium sp.]|uniref:mechanosensitive ion channel domain-containing protein n=1 Tax=Flavobacterium sp. TaxID=239 RepID=UPI00374FE13C
MDIKIIETIIVVIVFIIIKFVNNKIINDALKKFNFHRDRRKITVKAINFFSALIVAIILLAIWGVKQDELLVFITSILTVLGIAFFAQWSILSNVTSSLILFFNHPLKIGDYIKIIDTDQPIEGVIQNITYFFLYIKNKEDEIITIPNTIVLQKSILIKSNQNI